MKWPFMPTREERIEIAAHRLAKLVGERTTLVNMRLHYANIWRNTDPNVDWWRFADAKQKWHDLGTEIRALQAQIDAADERLQAVMS